MKAFLGFFYLKYWFLYVTSLGFIVYSLKTMRTKKITRKRRTDTRRLYYSICFLLLTILFNHFETPVIKPFGINKLGLAEELWFSALFFLTAFVLDLFIISAPEVKELSIGNTKVSAETVDDMSEQVDEQRKLTADLTSKISAQYRIIQNIDEFILPIKHRIDMGNTVEFDKEFISFLSTYFEYQDEYNIGIDVLDSNKVKEKYELSESEFGILKRHLSAMKSYSIIKGKVNFLLIPFESFLYDTKLWIILHSQNKLVNVEQFIILLLLLQFEQSLINIS